MTDQIQTLQYLLSAPRQPLSRNSELVALKRWIEERGFWYTEPREQEVSNEGF